MQSVCVCVCVVIKMFLYFNLLKQKITKGIIKIATSSNNDWHCTQENGKVMPWILTGRLCDHLNIERRTMGHSVVRQ